MTGNTATTAPVRRPAQPADRGDTARAAGGLGPPPGTCHRRAGPRRHRRHRAQRLRHRPRRRCRPQLPLPTPRPARQDPRPRGHPTGTRDTCGPAVTRASLQADLLAAGERAQRLNGRVRQLEKRLSEALGEKAWQESGLGVPADVDALNQKISHLEQQAIDLRLQLDERDQDLTAARAANRELIAQLNTATTKPVTRRTWFLHNTCRTR